ncbi:hypothetical protein [Chondrinema litorale]|uniref:hypothetical protein n=1 Tax=Chondrinema litorale TaxID=2994555 RepID=UPI0025432B50|nr:hypothetical protein [Chondrinema litorale]UZR96716.1 hypothetical protein OQ292_21465 [Chondrinema litorale]
MKILKSITAILLLMLISFTACDSTEDIEDEIINPEPDEETDPPGSPPKTWTEIWLDHRLELERVYFDEHVAVYYDKDVPTSVTWPHEFMSDVWQYVKTVYGNFGAENRLYVVCHGGTYNGGRTGNIFDEATGYRSLSDVTSGDWETISDWNIDAHVHEVGHVVEGSSHGVHESPAFDIWKDSKWAEIFQYDVYKGLGREEDAERIYNLYINGKDDFPRANTYWFKDWFYPIYENYGESAVLNNFFELLSKYFPKNGQSYARRMNMGEFVHFWSGAAGKNLKGLATDAFGWSDETDKEFLQAQKDFYQISY